VDKGDTIDFTGVSHLLLKQVTAVRPAPPPPALPARVEQSAARLAAGEGAPMASAGKAAAAKPHAARRAQAQTATAARSKMRRHGE
jgi:hypothetical protein